MISLLRRLCGLQKPPLSLGRRGEQFAGKWLTQRGYKVLERNVTFGDDEADLVAIDPDGSTIVIVEVKTRESNQPPPEASVGRTKQFRLSRCAALLAKRAQYRDRPFRFDVIAVVWPEGAQPQITHFVGAFESRI